MKYTILTILLFFSISVFSQERITITGHVKNYLEEPIVGVVVYAVKNYFDDYSANYTVTDIYGDYKITAEGNEFLYFTFVGYEKKVVRINGQTTIDVVLEESKPSTLWNDKETYYTPTFSVGASATLHGHTVGYTLDAIIKLPYWFSSEYEEENKARYNFYNRIKRYSSIGINLAKITPSDNKLLPSIYYEFAYPFTIKLNKAKISPFAQLGLYLEVDRRKIESQNLTYSIGASFSSVPILNFIPYTSWVVGLQGFNKRSEYNNLYVGLRFTFPDRPVFYVY